MKLDDVYTLSEAAKEWGISSTNLRNALNRFGRFDRQIEKRTAKKSCGTWLVTGEAMKEVFGPKRTP